MTTVAVIVVSFNTRDTLRQCLRALSESPPTVTHDLIVVDNASTDGSAAMVTREFPRVRLLEAGANVGFARANNVGIRGSSSELVLLLNSDALAPPGAVDALVSALRARPDAAVVGPRLVDAAGRAELSFGRMVGPFSEARQKLVGRLYDKGMRRAVSYVDRVTRAAGVRDWVSGACLLVRRTDAEAVGGLDERYFMYLEDVDFCAALRARGRQIWFAPEVQVTHLRGTSRAAAGSAIDAHYRRSQIAFYEKHHPRWAPILRAYLRVRGTMVEAK